VPTAEAFRRRVDRNYTGRKGYRERFLRGHPIPLPTMKSRVMERLANNLQAEAGDDPHEFPYEHFSIYVDGTRGLPLIAACNIDGNNLKSVNRKTGKVRDAESLEADPAPEAREKWFDDPRIEAGKCGDDELYTRQRVSPGTNRLGRIFHRGHIVRRLDPCWGSATSALCAEADTFHFTNCTPQVGAFNTGKNLWQGLENHVLDNAKGDRISVFTGPILDDDDPSYRDDVFSGFRVPLRFWKIAVWVDQGDLKALALIADQSPTLREIPEHAEDLDDTDAVKDFIAVVPWIEDATGLDFGDAIRDADIHEAVDGPEALDGGRIRPLKSFDELDLAKRPSKSTRGKSRKRDG
jgi:endonuclease G